MALRIPLKVKQRPEIFFLHHLLGDGDRFVVDSGFLQAKFRLGIIPGQALQGQRRCMASNASG